MIFLAVVPRHHHSRGLGADVIPYESDIVAITRGFNAKEGFTAAGLLKVLESARKFSTDFATRANGDRSPTADTIRTWLGATPGTLRDQIRRDLGKNLTQIDYLMKVLASKGADPYVFKAQHKTFQDVKQAVLTPYYLASKWGELIAASNANTTDLLKTLADNAINLPSNIVGGAVNYVADQARKILPTIPWWIPVTAVGLVGAAIVVPPIVRGIASDRFKKAVV